MLTLPVSTCAWVRSSSTWHTHKKNRSTHRDSDSDGDGDRKLAGTSLGSVMMIAQEAMMNRNERAWAAARRALQMRQNSTIKKGFPCKEHFKN
jgi:hypothetical protein